jgi:hypothetical protein
MITNGPCIPKAWAAHYSMLLLLLLLRAML